MVATFRLDKCLTDMARFDFRISEWINTKTAVLFAVFGVLAYLISKWSPLEKEERDRLALVYPILVLIYSVFNPFLSYYYDYEGRHSFAGTFNSIVVSAFGVAFSLRVLRAKELGARFYGALSILIFLFSAFARTVSRYYY